MFELNIVNKNLLTLLSDNLIHSGNDLANELSLSRTAVWKHIKSLKDIGYVIDSIASKGYQLITPEDLLSAELIQCHLSYLCENYKPQITTLAQVNSTNDYLKQNIKISNVDKICIAEQQNTGRGRFSRYWHSPFGQNIYLSIKTKLATTFTQLSGYSLCISLAIIQALKNIGLNCAEFQIKWPNDILLNGCKVAGILVELSGEVGSEVELIIGIGLNVNMMDADISQDWTSLAKIFGKKFNRNEIIANILFELNKSNFNFAQYGFNYFYQQWCKRDCLFGRLVNFALHDSKFVGKCAGIDYNGNIKIEMANGEVKIFSAGEISFHKGN